MPWDVFTMRNATYMGKNRLSLIKLQSYPQACMTCLLAELGKLNRTLSTSKLPGLQQPWLQVPLLRPPLPTNQ